MLTLREAAESGDPARIDAFASGGLSRHVLPVVSYRPLGSRQLEGRCYILMRCITQDDRLDYHELEVETGLDGRPCIVGFHTGFASRPAEAQALCVVSRTYGALYAARGEERARVDFQALLASVPAARILASIELVGGSIGGDPVLDALAARVHLHLGDRATAVAGLEAVLARFPDFGDAYWELLALYLEAKQHGKAVSVLERAESQFEYLRGISERMGGDHPDFMESQELRAWLARRDAASHR